MSLRWTTFSLLLAVAAATTPRFAAAQQAARPSPAATPGSAELAKIHYKEGVRLLRETKWAEAEAALEKAWALDPAWDVAFNLASVEYRQGKHGEAAEHFSRALRAWPLTDTAAAQRATAVQRLAELREHVGALKVSVNVEHAEVLVDGVSVGKAPLPGEVFVDPGKHTVEAKLEGYTTAQKSVSIEKGATEKGATPTVELKLVEEPGKAAGASGVEPGAVAKRDQGAEGGGAEGPGGEGGPNKAVIVTGIALSAAAITGGAVFGIMSGVKAGEAEDLRTSIVRRGPSTCLSSSPHVDCRAIEATLGDQQTFLKLSVVSLVVGGVVGAGTAFYALAAPKPERAGSVRVVPIASGREAGLVLLGAF